MLAEQVAVDTSRAFGTLRHIVLNQPMAPDPCGATRANAQDEIAFHAYDGDARSGGAGGAAGEGNTRDFHNAASEAALRNSLLSHLRPPSQMQVIQRRG